MESGSGDYNHRVALGLLEGLDRKILKSSGGPLLFSFYQDYEPRGKDANGEFFETLGHSRIIDVAGHAGSRDSFESRAGSVAHILGSNTFPDFVALCSNMGGERRRRKRSLHWGATPTVSHTATRMTGM